MTKSETFEGIGSKLHAAWHEAAQGDGESLLKLRQRQVRKAHEKISAVRQREVQTTKTSRAAGGSSAVRRPA